MLKFSRKGTCPCTSLIFRWSHSENSYIRIILKHFTWVWGASVYLGLSNRIMHGLFQSSFGHSDTDRIGGAKFPWSQYAWSTLESANGNVHVLTYLKFLFFVSRATFYCILDCSHCIPNGIGWCYQTRFILARTRIFWGNADWQVDHISFGRQPVWL